MGRGRPWLAQNLLVKVGVEEVSVVASLVGRNVGVESFEFGLASMFLCSFFARGRSEARLSEMDSTKVAKIGDYGRLNSG